VTVIGHVAEALQYALIARGREERGGGRPGSEIVGFIVGIVVVVLLRWRHGELRELWIQALWWLMMIIIIIVGNCGEGGIHVNSDMVWFLVQLFYLSLNWPCENSQKNLN